MGGIDRPSVARLLFRGQSSDSGAEIASIELRHRETDGAMPELMSRNVAAPVSRIHAASSCTEFGEV